LTEPLEESKKEIMSFIENNSFNLFYGFADFQNEVKWDSKQKTWKDFLEIAKNENVKTIIYYESSFQEELNDINKEIKQSQESADEYTDQTKEIQLQLKAYEEYSEKLSFILLSWVKDGICYSFRLLAPLYQQFLYFKDQIQEILTKKAKTNSLKEEKRALAETKNKLTKLSKELVEWAKSEGLKKITRPQLQAYLLENEISITWENKLALIAIINKKLSQ
jgi:hypothetical protein